LAVRENMVDETEYDYRAIDFLSRMLAGATSSKNINRALEENSDWEPFLFCEGPHLLGPVLILPKRVTNG